MDSLMKRLLAIDYGMKRTGLAVTDPMQIIATALDTVESAKLLAYLREYTGREAVERFVLGMPVRLDTSDNEMTPQVRALEQNLRKTFPAIPVSLVDERFTSSLAHDAMIRGGMRKKDRRVKGNVDKISAVLILQSYMEARK